MREGDKNLDFLTAADESRMVANGSRLYFPKKAANGLRLSLRLLDSKGRNTVARVPLLACEQQATVRFGEADSGADVINSTAEGHLVGCTLDAEWWVRTMPMFGVPETSAAVQGYIRKQDGFFRIDF